MDLPFTREEIARFHESTVTSQDRCIDPQTWKDLDLAGYSELLAPKTSIFGQQVLHRRLKLGMPDGSQTENHLPYRQLLRDPVLSGQLEQAIAPLRQAETEIGGALFVHSTTKMPPWLRYTGLFPVAIFLMVAALKLSLLWMISIAIALFIVLYVQGRWDEEIGETRGLFETIQLLLNVARSLGLKGRANPHALLHEFVGLLPQVQKIHGKFTRAPLASAIPGVAIYADWFLLSNIRQHFKSRRKLEENITLLQRCYELTVNLEADLALARHLCNQSQIC
ncbi:MAG: hypothetical protein ABI171_21055 [Collimonas sp.]|uniref:hypothetical protein n=1 Tax=Collimonas sp. TaxID=1963772 RepID=UPI003267CF95